MQGLIFPFSVLICLCSSAYLDTRAGTRHALTVEMHTAYADT